MFTVVLVPSVLSFASRWSSKLSRKGSRGPFLPFRFDPRPMKLVYWSTTDAVRMMTEEPSLLQILRIFLHKIIELNYLPGAPRWMWREVHHLFRSQPFMDISLHWHCPSSSSMTRTMMTTTMIFHKTVIHTYWILSILMGVQRHRLLGEGR